jgi:hypothetical protein
VRTSQSEEECCNRSYLGRREEGASHESAPCAVHDRTTDGRDPKFISPVVDVPCIMFAFSIFSGWVICACTGLVLSAVGYARRSNIRPLGALLFAWLAGYFALILDPLGVLYWYMD